MNNNFFSPPDKEAYIAENGWHFNKKACEAAVKQMRKKGISPARTEPLDPWTKEQVDEILGKYGVKLEKAVGYDYVYVANMAKADFFKSSLLDEQRVALYIKDVVDDVDAVEGEIFACWYAKQILRRAPVDWGDYL